MGWGHKRSVGGGDITRQRFLLQGAGQEVGQVICGENAVCHAEE